MGSPASAYPHRADNKLYRILFPQVKSKHTHTHTQRWLVDWWMDQEACQRLPNRWGDVFSRLPPHAHAHAKAPIVQTRRHAEYGMDEFPQGTNAVVAVVSYTGYDMEDAMILNKVRGCGCVGGWVDGCGWVRVRVCACVRNGRSSLAAVLLRGRRAPSRGLSGHGAFMHSSMPSLPSLPSLPRTLSHTHPFP